MEQYSRYETFDSISLKEIQTEKNFHTTAFTKLEQQLKKKKEKLFRTDPSRWELLPEHASRVNELRKDKVLAMKYMLPKETTELKSQKDNHVFLTNQCWSSPQWLWLSGMAQQLHRCYNEVI